MEVKRPEMMISEILECVKLAKEYNSVKEKYHPSIIKMGEILAKSVYIENIDSNVERAIIDNVSRNFASLYNLGDEFMTEFLNYIKDNPMIYSKKNVEASMLRKYIGSMRVKSIVLSELHESQDINEEFSTFNGNYDVFVTTRLNGDIAGIEIIYCAAHKYKEYNNWNIRGALGVDKELPSILCIGEDEADEANVVVATCLNPDGIKTFSESEKVMLLNRLSGNIPVYIDAHKKFILARVPANTYIDVEEIYSEEDDTLDNGKLIELEIKFFPKD